MDALKKTKLQALVAVFERFHDSIGEIADSNVELLRANWKSVKGTYQRPPPGVRPSNLVAGLEQGLLELPALLDAVSALERPKVARALHNAILAEYPGFLATQQARLAKVRDRGRISSESEFYLVRHAVDIVEAQPCDASTKTELYRLIDSFEGGARRGA